VPHRGCQGSRKGLCQVKLVPSRAQQTIQFDNLNDPRLGGQASPLEKRVGWCHVVSELDFSQAERRRHGDSLIPDVVSEKILVCRSQAKERLKMLSVAE
jgi:hypothetical protein